MVARPFFSWSSSALAMMVLLMPACGATAGDDTPTTMSPQPTSTTQPLTTTDSTSTTAMAMAEEATEGVDSKVLFVGDSITYWNDGVDHHFALLAGSSESPVTVEVGSTVAGGAPLERLWINHAVQDSIASSEYDVVVLQEDLPETDIETFYEFARLFTAQVREVGAEPVLFMAWAYERLDWITMDEIAEAHRHIAAELDVRVAPVGLAWKRAEEERPDIELFYVDNEHPSLAGTYLSASVIYATIYGVDPTGFGYKCEDCVTALRPDGLIEEEAAILQRIAWETVQSYQQAA